MKRHLGNGSVNYTLIPHLIANDGSGRFDTSLDNHFLAGRSLISRKVASLLLSSSFGANALLYAVFLGYLMGLWGLLIQLAWMLSFYLLARFSPQIYASSSLHEFLETRYGTVTRRIAAACSIIGIMYFTGWEIAVARTSLESMAELSGGVHAHSWKSLGLALLIVVIVAAILYTSLWGRRASGTINVFLNSIKIACLVLLGAVLFVSLAASHGLTGNLFFPSLKQAVLNLSIMGFITNIIFNISWQFVDNSSWQSISSARQNDSRKIGRMIKFAGVGTLLTVNGIGTLLGTLMRGNPAINSTNALGYTVTMSGQLEVVALVAMIILVAFSAMSLFDGAILSVSQSLIVDLNAEGKPGKKVTLCQARIATLVIGIVTAWGVSLTIQALGGSIFNFVYVVIIAQLSLAGPVIMGLVRLQRVNRMWLAIILGLLAGIGSTIIGTIQNNQNLLQAAGTLTAAVSVLTAQFLYWRFKTTPPEPAQIQNVI